MVSVSTATTVQYNKIERLFTWLLGGSWTLFAVHRNRCRVNKKSPLESKFSSSSSSFFFVFISISLLFHLMPTRTLQLLFILLMMEFWQDLEASWINLSVEFNYPREYTDKSTIISSILEIIVKFFSTFQFFKSSFVRHPRYFPPLVWSRRRRFNRNSDKCEGVNHIDWPSHVITIWDDLLSTVSLCVFIYYIQKFSSW